MAVKQMIKKKKSIKEKISKGNTMSEQERLMRRYARLVGYDYPPSGWTPKDYTAIGWQRLIAQTKKDMKEGVYKQGGYAKGNKGKYGLYVFGSLHDTFSDELTANASRHSLQAIHPTWKIEVKRIAKEGFFDKTKSLLKTGYEKGKEYGKKGYEKSKELYGKGKETVKQKIHDKKKDIAIEVLNETREIIPDDKQKASGKVRAARGLVEEYYAEGGNVDGINVEEVLLHFLEAGLWASHDDNDENLDANYSIEDVSEKSKTGIKKGIVKFIKQNIDIIKKLELNEEQIGHDLFLDSQGHGAGFWDRGFGKDGDILSKSAEEIFPSDPPYVGSDGKIHFYTNKYAEGGYAGKTAEQVWYNWTPEQRFHFLYDHKSEFENPKLYDSMDKRRNISEFTYNHLPEDIKRSVKAHISMGQYAKGDKIGGDKKHKTLYDLAGKTDEGKPYDIREVEIGDTVTVGKLIQSTRTEKLGKSGYIKDKVGKLFLVKFVDDTSSLFLPEELIFHPHIEYAKGRHAGSDLKEKIVNHLEENYDVPHHTAERMVEEKNNEINSLIENDEYDVATISRQILGVGDLNYSFAKGGKVNIISTEFHSHKVHNPHADIVTGKIDNDSHITYVLDLDTGKESMEYYVGENYNVGSKKKSYSRHFDKEEIPAKYLDAWKELKAKYETEYKDKAYAKGDKLKITPTILYVIDKGDPSVGIFESTYEIDPPFSEEDIKDETIDKKSVNFFKENIKEVYGEFAQGKVMAFYNFERKEY